MKTFRISRIATNETILFIKMKDFFEAMCWVSKNYDDGDVDIEEVKEND